ncbi:MarR family winged helix-turn-helix transcriptional regulator [Psychromicrobium lacuslunae]|uniref:MarR family transcriptional regulator n=1 Tax=Psychromicrobium lacuslunae TaxID=1618207 RepID=A0A0D4BY82_9MICC|nr:MarR family transcriptional regulator [Psychromicrobium lacuslunae]AJT41075.1 MarR family transcriptional regulator [Psychromicrobium lacuslunae]
MDDGLADLLHRVVALLGEQARARMQASGSLTYSQLRLLGTLEDQLPMTQHRLAESLAMSDPAISRALQPLAADGLVAIEADPEHGRRKLVGLTERGSQRFHQAGRPMIEELKQALTNSGFPYERYLADTQRLAELLDPKS